MSTLRGKSHIGADGSLRIPLPGIGTNTEVEYTLEFHTTTGGNGKATASISPRKKSGGERRASLRRVAGSIDDPTFVRPSQGSYETRESLD